MVVQTALNVGATVTLTIPTPTDPTSPSVVRKGGWLMDGSLSATGARNATFYRIVGVTDNGSYNYTLDIDPPVTTTRTQRDPVLLRGAGGSVQPAATATAGREVSTVETGFETDRPDWRRHATHEPAPAERTPRVHPGGTAGGRRPVRGHHVRAGHGVQGQGPTRSAT